MDALEADIVKLKIAIADANAADYHRRLEREAERKRISGMVAELVALHQSFLGFYSSHQRARSDEQSRVAGILIEGTPQ